MITTQNKTRSFDKKMLKIALLLNRSKRTPLIVFSIYRLFINMRLTGESLNDKKNKKFIFNKKETVDFFKYILLFSGFNNTNTTTLDVYNFFSYLRFVTETFLWGKLRTLYYICNWVYTTNHKRIAVNYFWFVILSGIVGMVLATVIRLEFAYPGVGIFAGDSLQYLSLVTAHGVVMVFFMIMPLLFGAFANFLLPTQLGVHDVAFPRLNSAAFWFLPGGLLMLAQLVCVDRRYQRMNCFNIREIQSILKKRFFVDLINEHQINENLHKSMVGLKYKLNSESATSPHFNLFYNYGISDTGRSRSFFFSYLSSKQNNGSSNPIKSNFWLTVDYVKSFSFLQPISDIIVTINSQFKKSETLHFYNSFFSIYKLIIDFVSGLLKTSPQQTLSLVLGFFVNPPAFFNFSFLLSKALCFLSDFFLYFLVSILQLVNIINFFFEKIEFFKFKSIVKNVQEVFDIFHNLHINEFFFLINKTEYYTLTCSSNQEFKTVILAIKYIVWLIKKFILTSLFEPQINYLYFSNISDIIILYKQLNKQKTEIVYKELDKKHLETVFKQTEKATTDLKEFYSYFNYNSYYVYLYIIAYFFYNFISSCASLILNLFNFKQMSIIINNLNDALTSWYIPLVVSDNFFYIFWQKAHSLWLFFKSISPEITPQNPITNVISNAINRVYPSLWTMGDNNDSFLISFYESQLPELKPIDQLKTYFSFAKSNFFSFLIGKQSFFFNKTATKLYNSFFFNNPALLGKSSNIGAEPVKSFLFLNKHTGDVVFSNEEVFSNYRQHRVNSPVFKYDYKSGDYYPKLYKEVYPYLFSSSNDLTSGLRPAPWFFSINYFEAFDANFSNYTSNLSTGSNHSWAESKFNHSSAFYNFFYALSKENLYFNKRWLSLSSVDQKFYKFFHTSSMQQRIYNNWRQLKFTRESWRCKLLMARHQKTLYKRYVNEDGVFWSLERNAKDLLPGWAMITPFSSRTRFTAVGKVDIGLMGVLLVLNSSIISGANFLVTYRYLSTLNNRKMRDARAFFTEAVMVSSWMMIAANPMLVIGIIMLLSDRHWQTSFFDYSGGGDTVLFQHMFWFFGHPEVYVIIIPTFGFTNTMLSYYLKKRISARASLIYSMYTIAFLGFFVWGHHMYMVGLAHTTRMLFSTLTVMISVPAATKLMHWCVTTVNSSFAMELPLVCTFTFVFLFTSGGISGMCVAHTGMDVLFHDTFYVIGHFHVMLAGGAMIACFGAFYFYFVAIFGVKYSRIYAYLHFVYYLLGQLFTVIPMFWLGYAGMPRRVLDYPSSFGGWHSVISGGHMLSVAGLIAFFIMIFDSLRQAKAATRNTFGIGRYNTRLNFYLFELAKLNNIQQKAWSLFNLISIKKLKLNNINFYNLEHYESTLFSYIFSKK